MTKGNPHKPHLDGIKSLNMLKMEKNFIAHNEKGYPRQPYNDKNQPIRFLIQRIHDELKELDTSHQAYEALHTIPNELISSEDFMDELNEMREECADISNLVDYLFEKLTVTLVSLHSSHKKEKYP